MIEEDWNLLKSVDVQTLVDDRDKTDVIFDKFGENYNITDVTDVDQLSKLASVFLALMHIKDVEAEIAEDELINYQKEREVMNYYRYISNTYIDIIL
ncbi:hypothetical protein A3Q56_00765 [Intoshia linei]|uniref:Uncharacterized protein n=1 Tax=Intoshia linei TaxID=1819745 RepID=A0A177BB92_9BILA|nr:hypothetical protein A3Q56_00765 [Intoshia linei]